MLNASRSRWPIAKLYRPGLMLIVALKLSAGCSENAAAQRLSADENSVKAAFVYSFVKYTEWPEEQWNKSPAVRVCTTGARSPLSEALIALDPKLSVRGKELEVRAVIRPQDAVNCHILVLAGREKLPDWTRPVRQMPVLSIGESDGFAAAGGVIGFFIDGEKVRFEINNEAAQRAGLKLSSQLLKLARLVKDEPKGGR